MAIAMEQKAEASGIAPARPASSWKSAAITAFLIAVEGYDLIIFGLLIGVIATVFFPEQDAINALLMTVMTWGAGHIMRPLGGILIGMYADRAGRKKAITTTIILLAISTSLIGLIPPYEVIGVGAPLLLLLARLIQGFAAGGAVIGVITYQSEIAPAARRGYFGSWLQASQIGAFVFAASIVATLTHVLSTAELERWGWRVPFLIAIVLAPLSLYVRGILQESKAFEAAHRSSVERARVPLTQRIKEAIREGALGRIAMAFCVVCSLNVAASIVLSYMPTYVNRTQGIELNVVFLTSMAGSVVLSLTCLLSGHLSDRLGRKATMLGAAGLLAICVVPLFLYLDTQRTVTALLLMQVGLAIVVASYMGPSSAMLAEIVPTRSRSTELAVAYNAATVVMHGFSPLIVTWLLASGYRIAPGIYIAAVAVVSFIGLLFTRDLTGKPLP